MFRPHDVADSLCCRRDPSLLIHVRQVPGSYTCPDSHVSLLGYFRYAMVSLCIFVLDALKCLKRFERVIVCILHRTLPDSYPPLDEPLVAISPVQPIVRPTSRDVNTSAMLLCETSTTRDE